MSCSRTLEFCINHSFLLDSRKPKNFDNNFVDKIKSIKPQLELFLSYYLKYSEQSSVEFRKIEQKVYIKDFVIKLSQFLNLSCDISYNVLRNYLAVDGKLNGENLESMLTFGYDTVSLMKAIEKYYRDERLSLIRLFRYLFCDQKDEWKIIANIIIKVSGHKDILSLYNKIMICYEAMIEEMSQTRNNMDHWEDLKDDDHVLQSLEEQVLLLETMLLGSHFLKANHTKVSLMNTLRIFQLSSVSIESRISRIMSARPSVKNMLNKIGLLQGLVLVETTCLDVLLNADDTHRHFVVESDSLAALCAGASRLGGRQSDGVVMLLTSLLCTAFPSKVTNQSSAGKLAEVAVMKLDLFSYLSTILTSEPYSITTTHCSQLALVVNLAIFDLLSFMCHHVHINSLAQSIRHDLCIVMSQLLRPINLYSDVKFLKTGFLKMLEDLSINFPVNLDMLTVVSSLMNDRNDDKEIITILTTFLDQLPWFCDRRSVESNYVKFDDIYDYDGKFARACQLTTQYRPYRTQDTLLTLESGQEGFFLDDNAVWAVQYSAWDVIVAEVELTCLLLSDSLFDPKAGFGPALIESVPAQFQRLETILDFFSTCIKSDIRRELLVSLFSELWDMVDEERFLVDGCERCLVKMIDVAGLILMHCWHDRGIVEKILATKNIFPICHVVSSSERLMSNDSVVASAWQNLSSPTNVAIVQAFLRLSLQVITAEKYSRGDIVPTGLMLGSVVFVVSSVLADVGRQSTLAGASDLAELTAGGLALLTEVFGLEPGLYRGMSAERRERLAIIQRIGADVLSGCDPALRVLLAMSSADVESLLAQTDVSGQMLSIHGTEQVGAAIVLMSLSIVKALLSRPPSEEPCLEAVLAMLGGGGGGGASGHQTTSAAKDQCTRGPQTDTIHKYVLGLLELLGYPYGSKMARMALVVLRMLVLHTNVSIVACLGEKTGRVRDILLTIVGSADQDQVIRGLVFEFLAECVMAGRHGILQLMFRAETTTASATGDNDGHRQMPQCNTIGYDSCLDVLRSFQPEDGVSTMLLVAVSKLLLSLWINDCQSNVIPQKSTELWPALLPPLQLSIEKISAHDPMNLELYEYMGNVYGLLAMEIYSSSTGTICPSVIGSLNRALEQDLFVRFLDVFRAPVLRDPLFSAKIYLDKVVTAITWWKALLFTVLSQSPSAGVTWLSVSGECSLVSTIIGAVSTLMTMNWTDQSSMVTDLIDNLVSCVVNIVHKRVKLFSAEQACAIVEQITSLLTSMLMVPSFRTHRCHVDLLASCSTIILEMSIDHQLLYKTSSLAEQFILILTFRPSSSNIDGKTLVHALTTYMACNKDHLSSQQWITDIVNSGILVNCLSLLHDNVKVGDLSLLTQTILTFLIRVSDTRFGATRIIQSSLVKVMELDLSKCSNDSDIVAYFTFMMQLILNVLRQSGPSANTMAFRFVSTHWERLEQLVNEACRRMSDPVAVVEQYDRTSKMLIVAGSLFDLLWHLVGVKGVWSMYWSPSMVSGLMNLAMVCANVMVAVLSEPGLVFATESAYILRGTTRLGKTVSFSLNSPRRRGATSCTVQPDDQINQSTMTNVQLQLSSARLEASVFRLVHSCLMLYARATYLISEEDVYSGWEYTGTLLLCDFGDRRLDVSSGSLSFGCLFSLLSCTQHLLKDNLAPLVIGTDKICLDGELIRQTHELALGIIVSHSIVYLTKLDLSHKTLRSNFILNMKSELNCYLDGLSKSRRRSNLSSNSPISSGPKVTSTPSVVTRSPSVGESLDGLCLALDSFKKSLDCF